MVAKLVAKVRQLVQDGLGHRQTPATLDHYVVGHAHRRQVDIGGRVVVGEGDPHLIADQCDAHADSPRPAAPGVFEDVGTHLAGGDRHPYPHVVGHVGMATPEGAEPGLNGRERIPVATDLQLPGAGVASQSMGPSARSE